MKRSIVNALVLAIPLELVNFFVFTPVIDVGLPDNAGWLARLAVAQWGLLHWQGLTILGRLGGMAGNGLGYFVLLASGYINTAILILACISFVSWIRRLASRRAMEANGKIP